MATRYLIGKGELLTQRIDPPRRKPGTKLRPYSFPEAVSALFTQIEEANESFGLLPTSACPGDIVVARVAIHPAFLAKSYFPKALLDTAGLASVGSHTVRLHPRKLVRDTSSSESDSTEYFVAGTRKAMRGLPALVQGFQEETDLALQFAEIESVAPFLAAEKVKAIGDVDTRVFEVGLHILPGASEEELKYYFMAYARECQFKINEEFVFSAGGMVFLAVEGPAEKLPELAKFTLTRVLRPMPRIRGVRPLMRGAGLRLGFQPSSLEPVSREPKVAILDGGLPDAHSLGSFVRRYFVADEDANPVPEYLAHGLGVTSAFLFGPIEPGTPAQRPYAAVDHHRVLDAKSDEEDPYELFRTLANVETILLSRQYQFINLSLGPDLPVEDREVHAWTSVIDTILCDGETLLSVAVGNNGERDDALGLSRIQVPGDSVNALCVGAADLRGATWTRAPYSAKGPGRSPGRRKPDIVAFGGSAKEYFHVAAPGIHPEVVPQLGTSFAAPFALRSAVGIRAVLGDEVHPFTTKALLIHGCEGASPENPSEIGWGRVPEDINQLITCGDGIARIIYQGELRPGKYLRARVPLPKDPLLGMVNLKATFCYASPTDPQDAAAYTKAGLDITFRPHKEKIKDGAAHPNSAPFFPQTEFRTEEELRSDLGKWETALHATDNFRGTSLNEPVFDIHYNARESGGLAGSSAPNIRYALVLTVSAPRHPNLHEEILRNHVVLQALVPQISLPIRLGSA
jgi:hypothetical protein